MRITIFNDVYNFINIKWVALISKHLLRVLTTFLMDTIKGLILVIDFKLSLLSEGLTGVGWCYNKTMFFYYQFPTFVAYKWMINLSQFNYWNNVNDSLPSQWRWVFINASIRFEYLQWNIHACTHVSCKPIPTYVIRDKCEL